MKLTRRTNARLLIGSLRRRIRSASVQTAKANRARVAAVERTREAIARNDAAFAEIATLRATVADLKARLATYRRDTIDGRDSAPPAKPAPPVATKPLPRKGTLPAGFDRLEVD